ncbi:MAG: FAD-binding oxidoreductase [Steroidobacteraceae bacterium]|nr:FAD-binding oxidoreductase [Steroidobacteraceae bacterium]
MDPDKRPDGERPPLPWSPVPSVALADALRQQGTPPWLGELRAIVGAAHVLTAAPDLWVYCRDRSPYAVFNVRNARVPTMLPSAVACPGSAGELAEVIRLTRRLHIPVIPFGAGSGVLGGTLPLQRELVIDLKRLNRIVDIDETDCTVTVEAGMNGAQFEAALNTRGLTAGHLPQSLHMSTVGGWAACRGAGQTSTRYGKIEDMVLGLEVVLPDGRLLRVRPVARRSTGPSIKDLFVGSEGAFGVITQVTLRAWRLPEARHGVVLGFPTLQDGFDALRKIMQAELRPAVVRLYDAGESANRSHGRAPFDTRPFLAVLEFCGSRRLAALERELALEICEAHGAVETDDAIYREWQSHRFQSFSVPWQARDYYVDTIEVTAPWSVLPALHAAATAAIASLGGGIDFGVHWSHVYSEGACQYMTIRLPPMPEDRALPLLRRAWDLLQGSSLAHGCSISHHHGVGMFRNPWLAAELEIGLELLQALKDHVDPESLFVAGKLGLLRRDAEGCDA